MAVPSERANPAQHISESPLPSRILEILGTYRVLLNFMCYPVNRQTIFSDSGSAPKDLAQAIFLPSIWCSAFSILKFIHQMTDSAFHSALIRSIPNSAKSNFPARSFLC